MLEKRIQMVLDQLSNHESSQLIIKDEWIEEAGEQFKDTMRRQFGRESEAFRLRMSNIGRATCQLQLARDGAVAHRKDYNFMTRMMLGDACESILDVILRIAGANITGSKDKVKLQLGEHLIKGEDDIEIDNKVYDIKSCSPWAFDNKWKKGYSELAEHDDFGYVPQLVGYAAAKGKVPGGWIVMNKSTGEILVVEYTATKKEYLQTLDRMEATADLIASDAPFKRCFEPVEEYFSRTPTDSLKLGMECGFCDFVHTCYPKAQYLPVKQSKAKAPPHKWYVRYNGTDL